MTPIAADLQDEAALADTRPTHVVFASWLRQASEVENIRVNAGMVRNLLAALRPAGSVRHADLGRPIEVFTEMTKSRKFGFAAYQPTDEAFFDLFEGLRRDRLIP